jgi:hypothetical protein
MRVAFVLFLLLSTPLTLCAQDPVPAPLPPEPKPIFVFDARAGYPGLPKDATVATALGVDVEDLPGRGPAVNLGAQFYFPRRGIVALGVGGEMLWSRMRHTVQPTTPTGTEGPALVTDWTHMSPQISLNFGTGEGWSYLTGGLGWSKLTMALVEEEQDPATRIRTVNYGGGAKWFLKKHLAFTVDLRWYSIGAQEGGLSRVATPAMRVLVFTGGFSVK